MAKINLPQVKATATRFYDTIIAHHRSQAAAAYDRRNLGCYLSSNPVLTADEKSAIKQKWGKIIKCIPRGYDYFRGIKALSGFNPDYLPSSYFFPYIEGILNPEKFKRHISHKSLLELIYSSGIKHPNTVLRSYGGIFLDNGFKPLTLSEAINKIKHYDSPLIFKPATDSEQGHGIRLIHPSEFDELCTAIKDGSIFTHNADFVLQVPVSQSEQTKLLNPSSLNCMRITTFNINNRVSVGTRAIKCGPQGSLVDNIGSGRRGVMVGISPEGVLCEKGFYGSGEATDSHNGVKFAGKKIHHFQDVIDTAVELHHYVPMCKIIGWDIALDVENQPVLIEGNVVYPGISVEQMCSGPVFGDRTDEVIDYIYDKIR